MTSGVHIDVSLVSIFRPPDSADVETLRLELAQVKERNKELEDEVSTLKQKVDQLEGKAEG